MLAGEQGEALGFAMDVVTRAAEIMGAARLVDIGFVHIDACHYYGRAHLDFAQWLVERGARFAVPAWTNTLVFNLEGKDIRDDAAPAARAEGRRLPGLYEAMGATPVHTCAPYQLPGGPGPGDHIAGSESNAVAYYNSVVGARTNKYGDFLEVCCGLTGRAPYAGLHTDAGRRGTHLLKLAGINPRIMEEDIFYPVLGHLVGTLAGNGVPVIEGLPAGTPADRLKALSAAAAASGGVALFHAVGVTPEAPDTATALGGRPAERRIPITPGMLVGARDDLGRADSGRIDMVAVGTPHFSFTEFGRLAGLLDGVTVDPGVTFYVTTSRHVRDLAAERGWIAAIEQSGVQVIVDTCTYFAPAVRSCRGRVMTNSAKWAYYAPGMLDVEVVFGSLAECVESARRGTLWRDATLWDDRSWGRA